MRKLTFYALVLIVLAGAGWSALWFWAAHTAAREVDAWLKSEDAQGRDWTCPDRAIGGYPLAIRVTCATPTFTGRTPRQTVRVETARLSAELTALHPDRLSLTLEGPLTYTSSDGEADVRASWRTFSVALDGLASVQALDLRSTDLKVEGTFGDAGRQSGSADRLDVQIARADATAATPDYAFAISVAGTAVPPLDAWLGGTVPVDLDLNGQLLRADVDGARTPREAIEKWRRAAGEIALAPSSISRAGGKVSGTGTLRLDEAHRLQGKINASFVGLEPILKRYGIDANVAAAGSLLSSLFGGGRSDAPAEPGAIALPISFQNGFVGIGPIHTEIALTPLY